MIYRSDSTPTRDHDGGSSLAPLQTPAGPRALHVHPGARARVQGGEERPRAPVTEKLGAASCHSAGTMVSFPACLPWTSTDIV